jgi:hypothetical protein
MSDPTIEPNNAIIRSRGFFAALAGFSTYFGLVLAPEWWPGFGSGYFFFWYVVSVPAVLIGLLGCLIWGGIGTARAHFRGSSTLRHHRALVVLPLAGLLVAGATTGLARLIRGGLPSGSHISEFDPAVWRDPTSSNFVQGDITPRQKMLGSVVERLAPPLDRYEIEAFLGPSLDTPYFANTGRDLIYILGPERDSLVRIDFEWLAIWLDDSNQFERFQIFTD